MVVGSSIDLHALCGRVSFFDVDAMWNGPGRAAQPFMQDLHEDYEDQGLAVVTILFQDNNQQNVSTEDLEDWAEEFDLTFPVVAVTNEDSGLLISPDSPYIPYFIFLDRDMRIRAVQTGLSDDDVEELLEVLLAED